MRRKEQRKQQRLARQQQEQQTGNEQWGTEGDTAGLTGEEKAARVENANFGLSGALAKDEGVANVKK